MNGVPLINYKHRPNPFSDGQMPYGICTCPDCSDSDNNYDYYESKKGEKKIIENNTTEQKSDKGIDWWLIAGLGALALVGLVFSAFFDRD